MFYAVLIAGVTFMAVVLVSAAGPGRQRTAAFMTLALAQAFHLGNARSREAVVRPARALANRWAIAALLGVFALQALVLFLPSVRTMLDLVPLSARDWGVVMMLAAIPALVGQVNQARATASRRPNSDGNRVRNLTDGFDRRL